MPEMVPNDADPAWPLIFDWTRTGPEARDAAQLSLALSTFLQRRQPRSLPTEPIEETIRFGHYVRALREARGWSRQQLAERANLHPLAVALLESAALSEAELSATLVSRIAMAFDKPVRDLDLNPLAIVPPWDAQPFGVVLARHLERLAGYEQGRTPAGSRSVAEEPASYQAREDAQTWQAKPGPPALLVHALQLPSQRLALPRGGAASVSLVLEPASPKEGDLLLRMWVQDEQDTPLPGILLAVDLDDHRHRTLEATNDQGSATISLALAALLMANTFHLGVLDV
jgi:transcriptional regulator with XRE-family HTH domain